MEKVVLNYNNIVCVAMCVVLSNIRYHCGIVFIHFSTMPPWKHVAFY